MSMTRTEIMERLREIIRTSDGRQQELADTYTEASSLQLDMGFSSVELLYTVISIEEEFDIRFDDKGVSDFDTLGEVISYIETKLR